MATPSGESIGELTEAARDLIGKIDQLSAASGDERFVTLARASKRNRQMIVALVAMVVLNLCLGVVAGVALVSTIKNTDQLKAGATTSRQKALCPLYAVFLASDTKEKRAQAPDKVAYDRAFDVIRDGYDALGCKEFKGSAPELGKR